MDNEIQALDRGHRISIVLEGGPEDITIPNRSPWTEGRSSCRAKADTSTSNA